MEGLHAWLCGQNFLTPHKSGRRRHEKKRELSVLDPLGTAPSLLTHRKNPYLPDTASGRKETYLEQNLSFLHARSPKTKQNLTMAGGGGGNLLNLLLALAAGSRLGLELPHCNPSVIREKRALGLFPSHISHALAGSWQQASILPRSVAGKPATFLPLPPCCL